MGGQGPPGQNRRQMKWLFYDLRNPWMYAVHAVRGFPCAACDRFFQGRADVRAAKSDYERWVSALANQARALGWKRGRRTGSYDCPACATRRARKRRRRDRDAGA